MSGCHEREHFDANVVCNKRNWMWNLLNVGVAQMKLNAAQLKQTLGQLGGRAISDDDPITPQLNDLFGEHTFLLDPHGLNIVEPVEEASGPAAMSGPSLARRVGHALTLRLRLSVNGCPAVYFTTRGRRLS